MTQILKRIDLDFKISKASFKQAVNCLVPVKSFVLVEENQHNFVLADQDISTPIFGEIMLESKAIFCTVFSILFEFQDSFASQTLFLVESTVNILANLPLSFGADKSIQAIDEITSQLDSATTLDLTLIEKLIDTLIQTLKFIKRVFIFFTQSYLVILTLSCLGGGLFFVNSSILAKGSSNSKIQTQDIAFAQTQSIDNNNQPPKINTAAAFGSSSDSSSPTSDSSSSISSSSSEISLVISSSSASSEESSASEIIQPSESKVNVKAAASLSDTGSANSKFVWPARGSISRCDLPGHLACDIANSIGTPIEAASSGIVEEAGFKPGGFGNMIEINHGHGLKTIYMHLSSIQVIRGQFVNQADRIGLLGTTGNSTGPHLHFGVFINNVEQDPYNFLP